MKTHLLALALLAATTAQAQTIGALCDDMSAEDAARADAGFERTFCDREPWQMRRQLNKLFAANRMLFNPNAVALTPRDQENPRWVEFPRPDGWWLYIERGVSTHGPYHTANLRTLALIRVLYRRERRTEPDYLRELHLSIDTTFHGTDVYAHANFVGVSGNRLVGCLSTDSPRDDAARFIIHEYDREPSYRQDHIRTEGTCDEGRTSQFDDWALRLTMGMINYYIIEDHPFEG